MLITKRWLWGLGVVVVLGILAYSDLDDSVWCSVRPVSKVPTNDKVVAITIDDGPHPKTTPEILAVLREKDVKVTFFVLGVNAQKNPKLVAQELLEGHEIGSHAYSHTRLVKLSEDKIDEELNQTERAIMLIGPKPTLFRPPGGAYNSKVLSSIEHKGYTMILWSVDPDDWRRPSVDDLVERVMANVKPGSIILLHDGQYPLPTPKALAIIIDRLRNEGYSLVTVSELLRSSEMRSSF